MTYLLGGQGPAYLVVERYLLDPRKGCPVPDQAPGGALQHPMRPLDPGVPGPGVFEAGHEVEPQRGRVASVVPLNTRLQI